MKPVISLSLDILLMCFFSCQQIVIHAMQCTHYIILWHLAKVSDSNSLKVITHWTWTFSKVQKCLCLNEQISMNTEWAPGPWTHSRLSQNCLAEHLLSSGRYGDLEETNEGLLLTVSALPDQHEHCSEGAGLVTVAAAFFNLLNSFCSQLKLCARCRPSPYYVTCCWSSATKSCLLGGNTWSLWSSYQTPLCRQSCSASFWIRCLLIRMTTVPAQVRLVRISLIRSERRRLMSFPFIF